MTEYLVFTLYGPLVSWGEIAVGESRHSTMYPTRSALLGILGAACGLERSDEAGQGGLRDGYRFGMCVKSFGTPLRDYHTVQYGSPARKQILRTRRDELERARKVETLLSSREYRTDAVVRVAVEALDMAPYTLEHLANALRRPHYVLYLGRKSCPPALPLGPTVITAPDLRSAFEQISTPLLSLSSLRAEKSAYFWDTGMTAGVREAAVHWRHDQPLSRSRWQFTRRQEWRGDAGGPA